jgi:hypothetical protein
VTAVVCFAMSLSSFIAYARLKKNHRGAQGMVLLGRVFHVHMNIRRIRGQSTELLLTMPPSMVTTVPEM